MNKTEPLPLAPELAVSQWFNAEGPITLAALRGKVVVIEAFQMLCPGCVAHGLPQAQQIHAVFPKDKVAVLGLHTVFEHHDAMTPVSLKAFIHEYQLRFPIGVDQPGPSELPMTMQAYAMRGTPSLIIIDQRGRLRANHFGQANDMQVAYQISALVHAEDAGQAQDEPADGCGEDGCVVDR